MLPRRSPRLLEKAARLNPIPTTTIPDPVTPPLPTKHYISYDNFGMDYEGYVIGTDNIAYHTFAVYEFENFRTVQRNVLYFTYKELFQFGYFIRALKRGEDSCLSIGQQSIQCRRRRNGTYQVKFVISPTITMRLTFTKNDEVHQELVQRFHDIHQDMGRQQEDLEDEII